MAAGSHPGPGHLPASTAPPRRRRDAPDRRRPGRPAGGEGGAAEGPKTMGGGPAPRPASPRRRGAAEHGSSAAACSDASSRHAMPCHAFSRHSRTPPDRGPGQGPGAAGLGHGVNFARPLPVHGGPAGIQEQVLEGLNEEYAKRECNTACIVPRRCEAKVGIRASSSYWSPPAACASVGMPCNSVAGLAVIAVH